MTGVRKRWFAVLAVVFVAAVVAAIVLSLGDREPEYQGRKLSEWVQAGNSPNSSALTATGAAQAIQAIGTNALPFLLRWIQDDEVPGWHRHALWIAHRLPFGKAQEQMSIFASTSSKQRRANSAEFGFNALGSNAVSAVPELTRLLRSTNYAVRFRAAIALGAIGVQGLPPLLAAARDEHSIPAVLGLCKLRVPDGSVEAQSVIRFLLECLKDEAVSRTAALFMPAREYALTVPALIDFLEHADGEVRMGAIATLERFGPTVDRSVLPTLIAALRNADPDVRNFATNTLDRIAPEELEKLKGAETPAR